MAGSRTTQVVAEVVAHDDDANVRVGKVQAEVLVGEAGEIRVGKVQADVLVQSLANVDVNQVGVMVVGDPSVASVTPPSTEDFAAQALGVDPTGWTPKWDATTGDFPVIAVEEAIGEQLMEHADEVTGDYVLVNDASGSIQDCHHQCRFMISSPVGRQVGIVSRMTGSAGSENGYVFFVNGDELEIGKFLSGSYTQIAVSSGFDIKPGHWYWMEATCVDVQLQIRCYEHGAGRPGSPTVAALDEDILSEGEIGVFMGEGPGRRWVDYIAFSPNFFSGPPTDLVSGFGDVVQVTDGRQFYDTFTDSDGDLEGHTPEIGGDWIVEGGDNSPQIVSNEVKLSNGDPDQYAYADLADLAAPSEEMLLMIRGRRTQAEMVAHVIVGLGPDLRADIDGWAYLVAWSGGFPVHENRLSRWIAGVRADQAFDGDAFMTDGGTDYEARAVIAGPGGQSLVEESPRTGDNTHDGETHQRLYMHLSDLGTGDLFFDHVAVFKSNRLVVKNLPDDYTIEAFGLSATAQAGIAVIQVDVGRVAGASSYLPDTSLVIKDDGASTVQTIVETATLGFGSLYLKSTPPSTPTLSTVAFGPTWWNVEGSVYSHPEGFPLQEAQFQITLATDPTFAAVIEDLVIGDDEPASRFASFTDAGGGLLDDTDYIARVRYKGDSSWSEWSATIAITTEDAVNPGTPVLSLGANFVDGARLDTDPYNHPDGQDTLDNWLVPHVATDWQISTSADLLFLSPIVDINDDVLNLESYLTVGLLSAGTTYIARARWKDANGLHSLWSNTLFFVTDADAVDKPGTPTVTVDEARSRGGDFSTDAYTHPQATPHDRTLWLITSASGFSPVIVTEDSATELVAWTTDPFSQALLPDTDYWVRAAWIDDLGAQGPWSAAVMFHTADALTVGDWVEPLNSGAVLSGASQNLEVEPIGGGALPGGVTAKIEHSDDWGATWNILQNTATLTFSWDTTLETDGLHLLRVSLDDGTETSLEDYRVVQINNGGNPQFVNRQLDADPDDVMTGAFNEETDWVRQWWHNYVNWFSVFAINDRDPGGSPSFLSLSQSPKPGKLILITQFFLSGFEGSFIWSRYWDTEINRAGVGGHSGGLRGDRGWSIGGGASPGVDDIPLKGWSAELSNWTIWPFGDARIIGQRGWSTGLNSLAIGGERGDGLVGPGLVGEVVGSVGVLVRDVYGAGLHHTPKYTVVVEATPTPLANGKVDFAIKAMAVGPGIQLDGDWQVDGVLTNMEACGEAGLSKSQSSFWGQGFARYYTFGVLAETEAECAPGSECPEDPLLTVSNILDTTVTLTGSAYVIPGIPAVNYTATAGAGVVDHAWTNADGGQYAKRIYYWEPGEDPDTDAGVIVRSVNPGVIATTTGLPVASGTHTYGVATIAGDGTILGWSNYDTVVIP